MAMFGMPRKLEKIVDGPALHDQRFDAVVAERFAVGAV
jgi:hypothetical protein